MTDRKSTTLGEISDRVGGIIQTGPFGSQLHESDYSDEGTPVVMPKDILDGRIIADGIARVPAQHVHRLSRHQFKPGDIVYGRRGDIGRHALIRAEQAGWLCGTGCLRISLGNLVVEPIFLHYYLCQAEVIAWIANHAIGATLPNLNTGILRSVPIRLPPLTSQHKIATILSAYDNLIENNLRRIKILEEMAQNLYREWFVKFRFPGYREAQFVDAPLGRIPERWHVVRMPEAVQVRPKLPMPNSGQVVFVPMGSISETSMLIGDVDYRPEASGARFQNGDTLFARITPCLENGKTGFVQFLPTDDSIGCGSTEFIVLRSKTLCPEYVYLMARSDGFRDNAIKSMSGASGRQRVSERCFDQYLLAHPPTAVIDQFRGIAHPQFELVYSLSQANKNLRRTRDLLLPKLISGEVDVSELDITIPKEAA